MPYFIAQGREGCEDGWAVIKADGDLIACHATKRRAVAQMVVLSLEEGIEPGGERP